MPRAISERPSARPLGGVGEPLGDRAAEALDQLGDVDAGLGAVAEQLARGAVGVGEPAVGLEPGQRHRQLVEEVVGHEAGDLGAVSGISSRSRRPSASASTTARTAWPVRGEQVHAVGAQRQVGEDVVERRGGRRRQRGGGGVGREHAALGVEAQPGQPAVAEVRAPAGGAARRARCRQSSVRGPVRVTTMRWPPSAVGSIATPFGRASRVSR